MSRAYRQRVWSRTDFVPSTIVYLDFIQMKNKRPRSERGKNYQLSLLCSYEVQHMVQSRSIHFLDIFVKWLEALTLKAVFVGPEIQCLFVTSLQYNQLTINLQTTKHSSGMRTARLPTVWASVTRCQYRGEGMGWEGVLNWTSLNRSAVLTTRCH